MVDKPHLIIENTDPFSDVEGLRLSQAFTETAGVKKLHTTVPVRKPYPQEFARVNPDPAYRGDFAIIDLKEDREEHLIHPSITAELLAEATFKTLYTAITHLGGLAEGPRPIDPGSPPVRFLGRRLGGKCGRVGKAHGRAS